MMNGYRSGFVSIIGCPNVGKSTLLNTLIGQKIAIVSQRAQTTRNKIVGVLTRPLYQIVFLDTPGVTVPKNKLGDYMLKIAYDALNEVEAILFVTDALVGIKDRDRTLIEILKKAKAPVFALINKADVASEAQVEDAKQVLENSTMQFADCLTISAMQGDNLGLLETKLLVCLEEGPQFFPDDMVTDQPERVVCAELVREKALLLLREEIPHGIGVFVDKMELRDSGLYDVWATIYCEREGHKGIIIGRRGTMLKQIGEAARHDMEWMLGTRVNLQLWVKVRENWRNSAHALRDLGYE